MSDKIDFSKLKHGAFSSQFKAYKSDNPSSKVKDLGQFADFVLKNHKKFQMKTIKRARFYNNVLRGGELSGGKLAVKDIKNLIDASYVKGNKSLDGFDIDNELSDNYVKVYKKNSEPSHAVVVHRGSADLTDWYLDSKIARGKSIEDSARYKHSLEIQKKAEEKYGADNVSTVGHSLGSYLSSKVGKDSKEVINLNKPVVPENLLDKANDKEHTIRSSGDVVSVGQRFRNDKNDRVIQATTRNPLTEHSSGILDRLDANEMIGEGMPCCLKKMSVKELKAMLKKMPKRGGVRLTGTKKKDLRSACGKCGCPCCMKGGADARQKGDASEMRQYIFEEGHKLKREKKPFHQYAPLLDLADDLNAIVHSNDPEQTNKKGDKTRRYNKLYDATNQYDPKAEPIIVKSRPIYEPLHAPREAEYLLDRAEIDYFIAHSAWEKRLKDAIAYNRWRDDQERFLDDFLVYKKKYDSAPPQAKKKMAFPRPSKYADTTFTLEKFPRENIDAIQAQEPKKPAHLVGKGLEGGKDWSKDEGKSLGFFGNIERAFDTTFNKKATPKEKQVLKPIFQAEQGLTDYVLKPLAPPVGKIAEAQRRFLEDKYLNDQ